MGKRADENWMPRSMRKAVIRETFEAIMAVGFTKWRAEELALGNELTEEDRRLYCRHFEESYFADFKKMAAGAPDSRLLDTRDYWIDKANTMGLKQWQEVLSKGEGGKPFYEAVAREVAAEVEKPSLAQEPDVQEFTQADLVEMEAGAWAQQDRDDRLETMRTDQALGMMEAEGIAQAERQIAGRQSVLGYPLPEPTAPPTEKDKTRGR